MKQDGYTLAEALAALLIIGLAMGGLFEGARVLSKGQTRAAETIAGSRALSRAQKAVGQIATSPEFANALLSDGLTGDARQFRYDCGTHGPCTATLRNQGIGEGVLVLTGGGGATRRYPLPRGNDAYFVYNSTEGGFGRWPTAPKEGYLRAITVMRPAGGGDVPLVSARVWIEQSRACEFDPISRTCRTP